ncbi:MAG: hypothetical protein ACHQHN_03595 [Sphingobacteriales bacterium]
MSKTYQSIYVVSHRWMFKNFGQGKLPQFKSMFNVSFLLIILLTTALLIMQFLLRSGLAINAYSGTAIMLGTVFFVFLNHLIFLNNKWFRSLNTRMALLSRHNLNTWSIVILINVIIICGFLLFTAV